MVACQRESIGDCTPLSSKALPPGVTRATLLNSRMVGNSSLMVLWKGCPSFVLNHAASANGVSN